MATETVGRFQLHLIALEASNGGWDPYVTIAKFDDEAQDFKCLLEKHPAADAPLATYEEAIEQARRVGNALLESGKYDHFTEAVDAPTGMRYQITPQQAP